MIFQVTRRHNFTFVYLLYGKICYVVERLYTVVEHGWVGYKVLDAALRKPVGHQSSLDRLAVQALASDDDALPGTTDDDTLALYSTTSCRSCYRQMENLHDLYSNTIRLTERPRRDRFILNQVKCNGYPKNIIKNRIFARRMDEQKWKSQKLTSKVAKLLLDEVARRKRPRISQIRISNTRLAQAASGCAPSVDVLPIFDVKQQSVRNPARMGTNQAYNRKEKRIYMGVYN
ncbi:hypothetical protein WN51_08625 [Melipona quadrifasciata]|uniref:Uncharacterized protein n=1 Tax=Melipona quadrifasciata TaxID=166423 RepID=A0A0M9A8X1_9HYME|nr:hypothetical protein WN51_08625 [Melipona quadrifasciata]